MSCLIRVPGIVDRYEPAAGIRTWADPCPWAYPCACPSRVLPRPLLGLEQAVGVTGFLGLGRRGSEAGAAGRRDRVVRRSGRVGRSPSSKGSPIGEVRVASPGTAVGSKRVAARERSICSPTSALRLLSFSMYSLAAWRLLAAELPPGGWPARSGCGRRRGRSGARRRRRGTGSRTARATGARAAANALGLISRDRGGSGRRRRGSAAGRAGRRSSTPTRPPRRRSGSAAFRSVAGFERSSRYSSE